MQAWAHFREIAQGECSLSCQRALTQKQTLWGGGALELGHRALLEPLAELGDALRGVGALLSSIGAVFQVDAAQGILAQAARAGV